MAHSIKVQAIDIGKPLPEGVDLHEHHLLQALICINHTPLGYVYVPAQNGWCSSKSVAAAALKEHVWPLLCEQWQSTLQHPIDAVPVNIPNFVEKPGVASVLAQPLVSVAVCTRDRTEDLRSCLRSLTGQSYTNIEILVVDNAPTSNATEKLLAQEFPSVRHIHEPRPGLDWARNRAILEAQGEIIAFTDDDVVVDSHWIQTFVNLFSEAPDVMAVTGLVAPLELETDAQHLFEQNGGFGRGFQRRWQRMEVNRSWRWQLWGTGQFGTGANMAFRRALFAQVGLFDPALDVGTTTNGGGDLEIFFRTIKEGYTLVYEPRALVYHRHRRTYTELKKQLRNNGSGLVSYMVRSALHYPDERLAFAHLLLWWFVHWIVKRRLSALIRPGQYQVDLIWAEFQGMLAGLWQYFRARKRVRKIIAQYGDHPRLEPTHGRVERSPQPQSWSHRAAVAVRTVDLQQPLHPILDNQDHFATRVFVRCGERLLGAVDIQNRYHTTSLPELRDAIITHFGVQLLELGRNPQLVSGWVELTETLTEKYGVHEPPVTLEKAALPTPSLPLSEKVSIVIATYDRPDDLRCCLSSLAEQTSERAVEIVVVDNHPQSGLTPPVLTEFPHVVYVAEERQGLAYARNAGFTACTGAIAVATDDDVLFPPNWLEKLVAPFTRHDIMIVTGNVLPHTLEQRSQRLFEDYGGLGRGFRSFEVNQKWFHSHKRHAVPTWRLGATANAAFRTSIFAHPQIGLMDEALGPGMPSGVGEDTYLFYKVLKAGFTIAYEADAYVWHKHRESMQALCRQIRGYSTGHVAYNLTTFLRDRDLRGLYHICYLPFWQAQQILRDTVAKSCGQQVDYPLSLRWLELWSYFMGPWLLLKSRRVVNARGRSQPYIPPAHRHAHSAMQRQPSPAPIEDSAGVVATAFPAKSGFGR